MGYYYTKKEDDYILSVVRNHPTNLLEAFRIAGKKIHKTPNSIRLRYYNHLKNKKKAFFLFSQKKNSLNYKITRGGKNPTKYKPAKTKPSKWNRILKILFE